MKYPKKERILIVDDAIENIRILSDMLEDYPKSIAKNGLQAIKIAKSEHKPELIILDILMPEMDGFETVAELKKDPVTADIPVIFTTVMDQVEDIVKGFDLGAVDYVTKPYEPKELLRRVKTHLTISRLRKELVETNNSLEEKVKQRTEELNKSNQELKKAAELAEKAEKLKSEFLAQMSHEIRTPLSSLLMTSEMMQMEVKELVSEETATLFSVIQTTGKRIFRTVDMIMNMSQLQTGNYVSNITDVDILQICKDVCLNFTPEAEAKKLTLTLHEDIDACLIKLDEYSVRILLENLIDNAIKFTDKGVVEVKITKSADCKIVVAVSDTGIGIDEDFQSDLFSLFMQEEQGYSRSYDGIGLGLAVAQKFAQINSTQINFESKKGFGSRFWIEFSCN